MQIKTTTLKPYICIIHFLKILKEQQNWFSFFSIFTNFFSQPTHNNITINTTIMMEKFVFQELCLLDANNHILEREKLKMTTLFFYFYIFQIIF